MALLLITTTLNYSEITSLVVLEDAFSLFISFYSSLLSKCFFISKYSIGGCTKAFPSCFCPVWQQLRLWFINTVNLALRLLVLDPKCHRQVMQSADSIQTDSHRSNIFENFLIDYSIVFFCWIRYCPHSHRCSKVGIKPAWTFSHPLWLLRQKLDRVPTPTTDQTRVLGSPGLLRLGLTGSLELNLFHPTEKREWRYLRCHIQHQRQLVHGTAILVQPLRCGRYRTGCKLNYFGDGPPFSPDHAAVELLTPAGISQPPVPQVMLSPFLLMGSPSTASCTSPISQDSTSSPGSLPHWVYI